jgi:cobalt-precorrin-6B (C15)-methyltransferase
VKDSLFIRAKVPMTKEEVRAIALSKLDLLGAKGLLDIGAGTGSIAIEAKLMYPQLEVTAVERNPDAVLLIHENALKFSVNLAIVEGKAPGVTLNRTYDRFFIGGTGGNVISIIEWIEEICSVNSVVVMTFITLEQFSETLLHLKEKQIVTEVSQITVSKSESLGPFTYLKPNNPTFMICFTLKGEQDE